MTDPSARNAAKLNGPAEPAIDQSATPPQTSIPATLSAGEAADRVWDVVVVGAGPAGSVVAGQLARAGKQVLLVDRDRFPRWKVCGACLNLNTMGRLEAAGLLDDFNACNPVPLGSFAMATAGNDVTLALPGGAVLSRSTFDAMLIRAAIRSGAEFLDDTSCKLKPPADTPNRTLQLRHQDGTVSVQSRVVVAAAGLQTDWLGEDSGFVSTLRTASRIGIGGISTADRCQSLARTAVGDTAFAVDGQSLCQRKTDTQDNAGREFAASVYRAGRIYMAVSPAGYVGLTRQEDGSLNMAAALNRDSLGHNQRPPDAAREILLDAGYPVPDDLADITWKGTPALTRHTSPVGHGGVFLVGDACGYVEPFTGEGMAWALTSGLAVVPFVLAAMADRSAAVKACAGWETTYRKSARKGQRLCRGVAWALRKPLALRWAIPVLRRMPALAGPVIRRINGH